MNTQSPAYHLKDILFRYNGKTVLDIPELKIDTGSITGIMGPNGGGKSTLLKLLAFAEAPFSGQVLFKGKSEAPFSPTVRSKVTLLTQKPYLLKRSVFDNVIYGLKIRKDTRQLTQRANQALHAVGLDPQKFSRRQWHELSGGEAQRVALAARLILKPEVLLLDEPVASVDAESAELIRDASLKARETLGTTLVIISHDIQWLYSISDEQLSIYNGKIFSSGMENVITGPFESSENKGCVVKQAADGQKIYLSSPPRGRSAVSVLVRKKSLALDLCRQAEHPQLNQLSGKIISMMLEKKTGFILATAAVSDQSFAVRLTREQAGQQNFCPGDDIILKFKADEIEWI